MCMYRARRKSRLAIYESDAGWPVNLNGTKYKCKQISRQFK